MANPGYVRSSDGNNADNGSTWALANANLSNAMSDQAAGDRVWVSQAHSETTAGAVTITMPGTLVSPMQILCGDDSAEPPTALATTGAVAATAGNINFAGTGYIYGLTFTSSAQIAFNSSAVNSRQHFKNCTFVVTAAGSASGFVGVAANNNQSLLFENCTFKWSHANNATVMIGDIRIVGGGADATSTTPTYCFGSFTDRSATDMLIENFDFSTLGATVNIFGAANSLGAFRLVARNCKLPASWSGSLTSGTIVGPGASYEMYNCDSTDTNYRLWIENYAGSIKHETTIVRSGGASDGTTPLSWKLASSANAEYPVVRLESPEIVQWNDTTGASKTITVEVVTDNVTLTDGECWLEVQYLGTSGLPIGTQASDEKASVIASAANQASSSVTWTTTGFGTPVKQALAVTFTPQEKGWFIARVVLCKASTTVYVDPLLTVS